jgi:hypothetical protein
MELFHNVRSVRIPGPDLRSVRIPAVYGNTMVPDESKYVATMFSIS